MSGRRGLATPGSSVVARCTLVAVLVSANALLLTVSVLIRQNRMAQLAEHRAHLDLQINMLTERKVTKLLELVDTLRQRLLGDAGDGGVDELLKPADPEAIMGAIKKTDAGLTGAPDPLA